MGKVRKSRKKTQKKNHARGLLKDMVKDPPPKLRRYYEKLQEVQDKKDFEFITAYSLQNDGESYHPDIFERKKGGITVVEEVDMDPDYELPQHGRPRRSRRSRRSRRGRTRSARGKKSKKSRAKPRKKSRTKRGKSRVKRRRTRR